MSDSPPTHSVSVAGAVIREDGQALVIKRRDNGHWELPGGVLELGETFEEGVRREVLEETGVEVEVEQLSGVYKNFARGIVALVYRCRTETSELPLDQSDEAAAICWVKPAHLSELMSPAYAIRVKDAFLDHPASRAHDGTDLWAPGSD